MNRTRPIRTALCLLMTLTIPAPADQQVIYPPSVMPRVDMHTHMDAKTQYAKAVDDMNQWGGTVSITLAGLFWVKDNNGNNASPASVGQIPGNDMAYVREKLDDRILFVPGTFTIPSDGIWWSVDEIKTYYWNAARLIPRVRQVLEARNFKIGYELGNFKFDRLPPDVTVNKLTFVNGQPADLTGTLGFLT